MECFTCGEKAFALLGGQHYCRICFTKLINNRVRKTTTKYRMFSRRDKIIVGLSGGKDSVVLTKIISILAKRHDSEVTAVTIDEGIAGYRDTSISYAEKVARDCNLEHVIVSIKQYYGMDFDDIAERAKKLPCSLCGPIRRRILNSEARKLGADVVAVGHNLDDEAQTIILNWLRGDYKRLVQLTREPVQEHPAFIKRVRPLCAVQEPEIVLYALANNLEFHDVTCPYAGTARRNTVREFLSREEENHPGTLKGIVNVHDKLKKDLSGSNADSSFPKITTCEKCGEPAEKRICSLCRDLAFLETE